MSNAAWAIGSDIAGYRLMREFGRDAYGDVFLAANAADQVVVIRALDSDLAADHSKLMEFHQQAKLGQSVEHPCLVKVLEAGEAEGRHFAATEFLGLPSLKYHLQHGYPDRKRLEEHEAIRIVYLLSKTLEDLHENRPRPVVHRGIAPANVLLAGNGQPILSGLQWGSPIEHPLPYPGQGVTAELFQYLAPEQICERFLADPAADVYSLGCLLYTMLTGKIPFKGRDAQETLRKKRSLDFRSPETIVPNLSRSLVQIIRECLRAEPQRRPASMKRFREFLDCGTRVIGGYRLKAFLGSGNTGDVYQAVSPRGQQVAVKLLSPKIASDAAGLKRFHGGANASFKVHHPHLLEGLEAGTDDGQHYLATELVPGENLSWLVQMHGAIPEPQALRIGIQIAKALAHIHQNNLVHRDVKPSNLLIGPNGQVKLGDLGFAQYLESAEERRDITSAGLPPGACQYLPPEQFATGKDVDFRGDLYALGVTLFVLLTGKLPFKPASPVEMLMDKAMNRFPTVRQVNLDVSDATSRLVRWMMQADPSHRPPSADSFTRAAKECLQRLSASSDANLADEPTEQGPIIVGKKSRGARKPSPRQKGFRHQIALGLGVLFVATLAGLLLVNVW